MSKTFVKSTEVQTEYERGFANGKLYMRKLADDVMSQTAEVEARNAKLVAALEAAEHALLIHCPKCGFTLQQIREALAQQSTEKT